MNVEIRERVRVGEYLSAAPLHEVLLVVISPNQDEPVSSVIQEYGRDVAQRLTAGWTLLAMTMYPIGHRAGAGYPGMDLDKAMVLATYKRDIIKVASG